MDTTWKSSLRRPSGVARQSSRSPTARWIHFRSQEAMRCSPDNLLSHSNGGEEWPSRARDASILSSSSLGIAWGEGSPAFALSMSALMLTFEEPASEPN